MELGPSEPDRAPLGVGWMALALVLAAFSGAALGLVWDYAGFGEDQPQAADVQPGDSEAG